MPDEGFAPMFTLPPDYLERVYAGVLGKIIGVYLGRPFEMWSHQRIMKELGPIKNYVHEKLGVPLVVTDDDISGTFAFVRALEEHDPHTITSKEIGKTWLNAVLEKQSIFWWGGRGISTEHTAWLNLKHGIPAPASGSIAVNGKTVAEQIGAQIFIDGWALVSAGRPELAARLADAAGKVSHDGESVYAAIVWAAMEAEAFVSKDIDHLIDTGLSFIPTDCLLARVIADVRAWVKEDKKDWEKTRQRIEDKYGYDKFQGVCHVIPNHAIMIMTILVAGDNFDRAMEIINTCGWDTDCNSGNVGCLVAIIHGMDSFKGEVDWRGPVADRALLSTSDGGYSINNAARIALDLTNMGRILAGKAALPPPKDGAQYHFTLPGSVQGFQVTSPASTGTVSQGIDGENGSGLCVQVGEGPCEVTTGTSAPREMLVMPAHYPLTSSPLVYPGQRVKAVLRADTQHPISAQIRARVFNAANDLLPIDSDRTITFSPGDRGTQTIEWVIPDSFDGYPIAELGLVLTGGEIGDRVWLHSLGWAGAPDLTIKRPATKPYLFWDLAWIHSVHIWDGPTSRTIHIAQDEGEGIVSYGTRDWTDYQITASGFKVALASRAGVAIRVQGLNRYYALLFAPDNQLVIVKALDEQRTVLASVPFKWEVDIAYEVKLQARGTTITGTVGDVTVQATDNQYAGGALGFVVEDGAMSVESIRAQPATLKLVNGNHI